MTGPAIKGTTFQKVADDIQELLERGQIAREALSARLEAEDLEILEQKIQPTAWIPIASYERCVELLASVQTPGQREAYLVERGVQAAQRLIELGIYSQLEATNHNMGRRIGNLIVTVAGAIFNFGRWGYEAQGDDGFAVTVEDARAMPEVSRFTIQGFIQCVGGRTAGYEIRVSSERPTPDRVIFRAVRPG